MKSSQPTSTVLYAPEDTVFTHTSVEQFTYFSGSQSASRETFGMPVAVIARLITDFAEKFMQENKSTNPAIEEVYKKLTLWVDVLKATPKDLLGKKLYPTATEIAEGIKGYGHIPVILSKANAAQQYGHAGRNVENDQVQYYLELFSGSEEQAREFLVKQDIMKKLAGFRHELFQARYKISGQNEAFFIFNKLIKGIDEIIQRNRESMPKDCEQFDLHETFGLKIISLASAFDPTITAQRLKYEISGAIMLTQVQHEGDGSVYPAQKYLSDRLYEILIKYVTNVIGIKVDSEENCLRDDQAAMLQDILPLVAYLNSSKNPFARLGLFGKEVTDNDFHNRALVAYKLHESKVSQLSFVQKSKDPLKALDALESTNEKPSNAERKDGDPTANKKKVVYTAEQIEQLLYGPSEEQQKEMGVSNGFLGRLSNTVRGLLTESSAGAQASSSRSRQLDQLRALTTPEQYRLEAPKPEPDQTRKP